MTGIKIEEAVARIPNGTSLMVGGFMGVGTSERVMDELVRQGKRRLTVTANDTARPGIGIGKLIDAGALAEVIVSHIGTTPNTQRQMIAGELTGKTENGGGNHRSPPAAMVIGQGRHRRPSSGNDDSEGYAAFGRVVEGMDVVRRILAAPTVENAGAGAMRGQMLAAPVPIVRATRAD